MGQFVHSGGNQRRQGIEVGAGLLNVCDRPQGLQLIGQTRLYGLVRLQVNFVGGQCITALTGLGIFDGRQKISRQIDDRARVTALARCLGNLLVRPKCEADAAGKQEHRHGQPWQLLWVGFQDLYS